MGWSMEGGRENRGREEARIEYPQYAENYASDEFPW